MKVAVVGASPKPERYSNKAVRLLMSKGHQVIPINPAQRHIEGLEVRRDLSELEPGSVDTVTMYIGPDRSTALSQPLQTLRPRRVILNPGAENKALADGLRTAGIEVVEACTLVMLQTGEF